MKHSSHQPTLAKKTVRSRTLSRLHPLIAASILGSALAANAETLFKFEFNEGTGSTVTNTTATLIGNFGNVPDPANYPVLNSDSPSAQAADQSLTIVDPEGYLLLDTTGTEAFTDFSKPITAEAWIRIPETAAARAEGIVGFGGSWKLGLRPDGRVAFTLFGIADVTAEIYPLVGQWMHLATVWQPGSGVTFFVDGVEAGFLEETRAMRAASYNYLGIGSAGRGEPINASIDRVRVHQAALTAAELDSVAASPKPPLTSTLAAFNFDSTTAPYTSAGLLQRAAVFAQDVYRVDASPKFVTDSPSRRSGDTSLSFDGNDRVRVEDPSQIVTLPTGDFTVQSWVRFGAQAGARSVLFFNNGPGGAISFSVTSDRRVFVTTLGIADTPSAATIPSDNFWHHIAVVHRNGESLKFYVDGVLGDTIPYTGGVIMTRTDAWFFIGSEPGGGLSYNGSIDRLQFASEALEPADLDYLAIPGVIPDVPELEIGTAVSVAWPATATGFTLQSTTNLAEPKVWSNVTITPTVIDDKFYMLLPTPGEKTFYRLIRSTTE